MQTQLKGFQRGRILASDLQAILGTSWPRMWLHFRPCSKNLPEFTLKSFGLMALVEETSRQPGIDCHVVTGAHSYVELQ